MTHLFCNAIGVTVYVTVEGAWNNKEVNTTTQININK